jgi:probable H4MPT-linked C1 transfer pathway protein
MSKPIIGWDIGGAHLKAVLLDDKSEIINVLQLPCQLWKGLDRLEISINDVMQAFKIGHDGAQHAITMTGELVDLFPNRHTGVIEISTLATKILGKDTRFYAANSGFVTLERVSGLTGHIASTNWHASASALAMHVQDALMIDIGSTTTDIIAIAEGTVVETGLTDVNRMQTDSLVYTGVVRTPVMALTQKLPFEDTQINVAAEYFATMADVYRLTGELLPEHDMAETADGKGKSGLESARRLARMIGHDVETKPIDTWKDLANTCRLMQLNHIKAAVLKHLKPDVPIIGAGVGSFLVQILAHDLKHAFEPISMRFPEYLNLGICFSAYAVAELALIHEWQKNAQTRTRLSSR